jgi:hypothetical protein
VVNEFIGGCLNKHRVSRKRVCTVHSKVVVFGYYLVPVHFVYVLFKNAVTLSKHIVDNERDRILIFNDGFRCNIIQSVILLNWKEFGKMRSVSEFM